MKRRTWVVVVVLLAVAVALAVQRYGHGMIPSVVTAQPAASGPVVANGHGWTTAGLEGPMPAPGTCHLRYTSAGDPLPDPACTPGAVDPTVTQANLGTTVCRKGGYTASVRPPEAMTTAAKKQIMAAYGIQWSKASDYELDHLVELSVGGASDVRNLWPEPNVLRRATASQYVHNDKDQVEADDFDALCAGRVDLATVQTKMSTNWTA